MKSLEAPLQALVPSSAVEILAGLSICQLIYMAEVGVLILRSPLPLSFWNLLLIFMLRTAIVFPVFLVAGHWLL